MSDTYTVDVSSEKHMDMIQKRVDIIARQRNATHADALLVLFTVCTHAMLNEDDTPKARLELGMVMNYAHRYISERYPQMLDIGR